MASSNDVQVDRALMVHKHAVLFESLTLLTVALLFIIDLAILHARSISGEY